MDRWRQSLMAAGILLTLLVTYYGSFLLGRTHIWDDQLYVNYPAANYLASALAEGKFPLWLSGMKGGIPFYSDIGIQAFYPPAWMLAFFVHQGRLSSVAYQCYLVAHLLLAGFFIYAFLRSSRIGFGASVAGMVTFVFSAFLSLHFIHPQALSAFVWLPAQLYCVRRISDRSKIIKSYYLLIFCLLMSFLAGFPQVVLYNTYFIGAYWLFLRLMRCQGDSANTKKSAFVCLLQEGLKITGVVLVVILLGAALFIPAAENWSLSVRQQLGFAEIADESMPWYYLVHGFVPNLFGMSNGSGAGVPFWGFNKESQQCAALHIGGWQYWEFGFYAGQMAVIALAALAFNFRQLLKSRREQVFFLFAILPILLLMLGRYGGLFNVFYHVVPGFSLFRTPSRIGCLLNLCLAVLVAVLVDMLLDKRLRLNFKRPAILLAGLYGLLIAGMLIFGDKLFPEMKNEKFWANAAHQVALSMGLCLLAVGGCAFIAKLPSGKGRAAGMTLLVGVMFLDLYLAFHEFHQGRVNPVDYYGDQNGLVAQLVSIRERNGPFRFAQLRDGKISEEIVLPRNVGYFNSKYEALEGFFLFSLEEYSDFDSMANERARLDIKNVRGVANMDSRTRQVAVSIYTNSLPRAKFYNAIRSYEDSKSLCADLDSGRLDYKREVGVLGSDVRRFGLLSGATPTNAEAFVRFIPVTPEEYRIEYQTPAPGVIFVSESYYPGWVANDGQIPIIKVFGAFKGFVVRESGQGVIVVKFSPWKLKLGSAISLFTLVGLIVFWVVIRRKDGKDT